MKAPYYQSAIFIALLLAVCGSLGAADNAGALPEQQDAQAYVSIPGPLRSFLRMAAISQKVLPEEVLPFMARNVVVEGYTWQARKRYAE